LTKYKIEGGDIAIKKIANTTSDGLKTP